MVRIRRNMIGLKGSVYGQSQALCDESILKKDALLKFKI